MQQPSPNIDPVLGIQIPVHAGATLTPWSRLKFNPVRVFDLRRYQGALPAHPSFYSSNVLQFRAADVAWFASGTHTDGQHLYSPETFHAMHIEMWNDTKNSPVTKAERKTLQEDLESVIWDALTLLDRVTGSTLLLMRCKGTTVPGSPVSPEFIKAHVYFPLAFIAHNSTIQAWLQSVCQGFIENVGVRTVADWARRSQHAFRWTLTNDSYLNPHPNTILSSPTSFPAPELNSSLFVYPGQPCIVSTPPSSQVSNTSSYTYDDLSSTDLQILDLNDCLRDAQQNLNLLQHAREKLSRMERELKTAEEQNGILVARIAVLESGTGILVDTLQTTGPITPSRRPPSLQSRATPTGTNTTPGRTPAARPTSPQRDWATSLFATSLFATSPFIATPVNVTLQKGPGSRQATPLKPKPPRANVTFEAPDNHFFVAGSSWDTEQPNNHASFHHGTSPENSAERSETLLKLVLEAHELLHLEASILTMLHYVSAEEVGLRQELQKVGVPWTFVDKVTRAICFDALVDPKSEDI